jgi:DNA-binding NarL/FixJ family response regulator
MSVPTVDHRTTATVPGPPPILPRLTPREVQILLAWLRSDTKEEAAAELYVAATTVSTHIARIRTKYAAAGRPASTKTQLFVRAAQDGLIDIHAW